MVCMPMFIIVVIFSSISWVVFIFFFKLAATYRTEFHTHKMGGYMQFENTELTLIKSLAQC